jgi:hypothetical protein
MFWGNELKNIKHLNYVDIIKKINQSQVWEIIYVSYHTMHFEFPLVFFVCKICLIKENFVTILFYF